MPRLRLLLIDPHASFREAARCYLLRCREFRSVEVMAGYNEGLLLHAQHFPDLVLVDSKFLSQSPGLIHELEKLKQSDPTLDVLALLLFKDDDHSRYLQFPHLVSGFIYKENFSENLHDYLAARQKAPAGRPVGFREEVD
jgi:DNA-binding NarL/FixJ family response regulator